MKLNLKYLLLKKAALKYHKNIKIFFVIFR